VANNVDLEACLYYCREISSGDITNEVKNEIRKWVYKSAAVSFTKELENRQC